MTEFALAFGTGLLGGAHCIGMCGGFVLAAAAGRQRAWLFHAGRLTGYAVIGALAGLLGGTVDVAGAAVGLRPLRLILFGALLSAFGLAVAGLVPRRWLEPGAGLVTRVLAAARARGGMSASLLFGLSIALLPCGLLYPMYALAASSGSPLHGGALLVVFGLGTVPLLAAASWGLARLGVTSRQRLLRAAGLAMVFWGLWLGWRGVGTAGHDAGGRQGPPASHRMHGMD
jgi:hypothetical protein